MAEVKYVADKRIRITQQQLAGWTVAGDPLGLRASGPCAECGHEFSVQIIADVVSSVALDTAPVPPEARTTRRFGCGCLADHEGRPASVPGGCGRWWLATVVKGDGDGRKLIPAPDEALAGAASALEQATRDEMTAVRGWAEKWLPGVAALYGLFGLAGVVLGKDAFKGIGPFGLIVAALAIAAGLICTVAAIWFGYRAAFGWMSARSVATDAELEEWYRQRRAAVVTAPAHLRNSVIAASGALVLLLVAVGVIWFWPTSDPASPLIDVAYNADGNAATPATVCGKLLASSEGTITVQATVGTAKQSVVINSPWVTGLTPKATC